MCVCVFGDCAFCEREGEREKGRGSTKSTRSGKLDRLFHATWLINESLNNAGPKLGNVFGRHVFAVVDRNVII